MMKEIAIVFEELLSKAELLHCTQLGFVISGPEEQVH
jgi:hypothetical protein